MRQRWIDGVMLLAVTLLALLLPRHMAFVAVAENWAADSRATLFAKPSAQHPTVTLLTITEDTLAQFPYRFPVDRGFLAALLDKLGAAGAKAVGFDILFDQPTEAGKDKAFQDAIARFPGVVVVGWTDQETGLTEKQAAFQQAYLQGISAAYSNTLTDVSDSTIRRIFPGRVQDDGTFRRGFVPEIAAALGYPVSTDPVSIIYRLGPDAATPPIRTFPAHVAMRLPNAWFKDKIVLVGADLPFEDRHRTPLVAGLGRKDGTLAGVAIHAHALAQLVDEATPPRKNIAAEVVAALLLCTLAVLLGVARLLWWQRLLGATLVLLAFWALNMMAFRSVGLLLPAVAPSLAFAVMLVLAGYRAVHQREAETRFIRDAFSRYVAPNLVSRLQKDPDQLVLGGEKREITVLFTDVEGFTSMSEEMDASQLVAILNEYLDGMVSCVHHHEGMVDKFIGDAVMAVFGAPEVSTDHAARAIACALEMDAFATAFMVTAREKGVSFGRTRIGVHTGVAVVGNVGGNLRFDYTAIGDTVNTGSRMEGVNKYFGTSICVSSATAQACDLPFRPIGRIQVKGRHEALPAYTPVAAGQEALLQGYQQAYQLIEHGDTGALQAFTELEQRFPEDALTRFQVRRLAELAPSVAPSDLIVMKDK